MLASGGGAEDPSNTTRPAMRAPDPSVSVKDASSPLDSLTRAIDLAFPNATATHSPGSSVGVIL